MLHFIIPQTNGVSAYSYQYYYNHRPVTIADALQLEKKLQYYPDFMWKTERDIVYSEYDKEKDGCILVNVAAMDYIDQSER